MYCRIAAAVPAAVAGLTGCVELPEFAGAPIVTTGSLPTATGGTDYQALLEAAGGQEPYRWSAVELPPGLELSREGEISGLPSEAGEFDMLVVVADANGAADVASFPLAVTANPTIAASRLPPIHVLRRYNEVVDVLGGTSPYEVEVDSIPEGLVFSSNDAEVAVLAQDAGISDLSPDPLALTVTDAEGVSGSTSVELPVVGLSAIAPGGTHVCALDAEDRAWCWGDNANGQLGEADAQGGPVAVNADRTFSAITTGHEHTCALDADGRAWCWGKNASGQLGRCDEVDPETGGCAEPATSAEPALVEGAENLVAISAGNSHTCALQASGDVLCWGSNGDGRLGNGAEDTHSHEPVPVALEGAATAISVNYRHACALDESGRAHCWGDNSNDQLGRCDETTDSNGNLVCDPPTASPVPIPVETDLEFRAIAAGVTHTCGIDIEDNAWCWGANGQGQLGDGGNTSSPEPVAVLADTSYAQITAGSHHTCAVDEAGQVHCWGRNDNAQLGSDAGQDEAEEESPVPARAAVERAIDLVVSTYHTTCAIEPRGDAGAIAWCWGSGIGLPEPAAEGVLLDQEDQSDGGGLSPLH